MIKPPKMKIASVESSPCPFVVVSYYTPEYEPVFRERLGRSLSDIEEWGSAFPSIVLTAPSTKSWLRNCLYKSEAIDTAMRLTSKHVLWVDADAMIPKQVPLLDAFRALSIRRPNLDFAAYMPGIEKSVDHDQNAHSSLLSGTMVFMQTPRCRFLVRNWRDECMRLVREGRSDGLDAYDQQVLWMEVQRLRADAGLVVENLHPRWVKIHDMFPRVSDPLIVHYQASRSMKDVIR